MRARQTTSSRKVIIGAAVVLAMLLQAGCASVQYTTAGAENDMRRFGAGLDMPRNRVTVTVFWRSAAEMPMHCPPPLARRSPSPAQ